MLVKYSPIYVLMLILFVCFAHVAYSQPIPADASIVNDIVATPVVTAAQTDSGLSWWQLLLKHGIELAFFIITLMITAFVNVIGKKYKFEDYTNKINDVLARASGYAEQKAISLAKVKGKPLPSAEKMQIAINFAESLAKEYKLPKKGTEWWDDKLESWLGVGKDEQPQTTKQVQKLTKAKPVKKAVKKKSKK